MRPAALVACLILTACSRPTEPVTASAKLEKHSNEPPKIDPRFDSKFWAVWGDGKAEIASYDLTFPRYQQLRNGVAVAIFVTETFSNSLRVKADPGKHGPEDEFPVMKLNLVKDYQTGIYDYNDILSSFVALAAVNRRPGATITKSSFSSQEWCGHVYSQLLFGEAKTRWTRHSYFDGEADQQRELDYPDNGFSEDGLLLWARGMARPFLQPGSSERYLLLTSLETSRGKHVQLTWNPSMLSVDAAVQKLRVPAGVFEVEVYRATRDDKTWRAFYVEKASPRRIIRWENSEGEKADLLGMERLKYWEMNKEGGEKALERLGIPYQPRTPRARALRQ